MFSLKHGEYIVIKNVPNGQSIRVSEKDYTSERYKAKDGLHKDAIIGQQEQIDFVNIKEDGASSSPKRKAR